jgi:energy-coupling factor transporter ATP-binding protein EcfA2
MSNDEINNGYSKNIIKLKRSEALKQNGLVTDSVYYIDTNDVKISLNHAINSDIIFTIDKKKWQNNLNTIVEQAEDNGIFDKESKRLLISHLNDNHDEILAAAFSNTNTNDNVASDSNDNDKPKRNITTFKYSQLGKGDLYEAVFINNGLPVFIKYNDQLNEFESFQQIQETTRILTPPSYEECPYLRYEFESLDEINSINKFIDDNHIDLDYLYNKGYQIVSKYNNQSIYRLRLATIKIITSHFQDRFPTTEYLYLVGGNGSGKSSLAETFRAIGYRTVVMTDPSAPNLFRLLGIVEPVQCTMVLEEADKIDKITELMAVLKTGYSYYGSVPKINPYTLKQESFYSYCPKIIVSERSLNQAVAKGVNSRTFLINCIKGSTKHDIKEVLNPTNTGGPEKEKLLHEIMQFRKLLLVFRLRHFKDPIPDLDVGVEGRDKELVKHSIQLFCGCKCLEEVQETLQYFLDLKNEKKESTIESILLQIVATLVKYEGPEISSQKIWNELMEEIPGILNEKNPNEYHTNDYGTIYRTSTLPSYLGDSFGGVVKHTKKGNFWIFNRETIENLAKEDKSRITISTPAEITVEEGEGVKAVNTPEEGGHDFEKKLYD